MLNPSEITADLPSPRDDEPENLRGDIRDELADHLHCAMRRELLSGAHGNNENAAWQNVLKRFGSPARIALECWLIKMKGKLIMQKISLGISMAAVILCGVLVSLMWRSMEASQQTNASMLDAQAKMLDKMDKLVQATLDRIETPPGLGGGGPMPAGGFTGVPFGGNPQNQPVQNTTKDAQDWIPFKIKLVSGTKDGPPVVGQMVQCKGHFVGVTEETIERKTDKSGVVDFGRARPDSYEVSITMPWGEHCSGNNVVRLIPGYQDAVVVCPASEPGLKNVSLELDVPKDLQDKPFVFAFSSIGLSSNSPLQVEWQTRTINEWRWGSPLFKLERPIFNSQGVLCTEIFSFSSPRTPLKLNELKLSPGTAIPPLTDFHIYYGTDGVEPMSFASYLSPYEEQPGFEKPDGIYLITPGISLHRLEGKFSDQGDVYRMGDFAEVIEPLVEDAPLGAKTIKLKPEFWDALRKKVVEIEAAPKASKKKPPLASSTADEVSGANAKTATAQDWIPFKIKLVSGTKDGPPVVGQDVYCTGKFLGTTDESLKRVTDANGICDFGKVRVGLYTPTILMPWGDTIESARLRVSSEYQLETIVCPLDDKYHKVSFKFNVPDDLKDESLRFYINPTGLPLFGSRDFRNEDRDGTDRVTRSRFELDNHQWRINPFKEVRMFGFKANGDFNYNFIKGNDKYIPKSENLVANHLIVYYGDLEVVGLGNNHLTPIYAFLQKKKNEGVLETKANFLFNLDTKSVHELPPLSVSLYKKDSENPKSVVIDLQPDMWTAIRDGMVETKKVKPKAEEAKTSSGKARSGENESKKAATSQDWIPFKIKLVSGTKDGPPVVGQKILATGNFLGSKTENIFKTTDESGIVNFGLARPDFYAVQCKMPWGDYLNISKLRVAPGYVQETVVCPINNEYRQINFSLNVPDDLQNESLQFFANPESTYPHGNPVKFTAIAKSKDLIEKTLNGRAWTHENEILNKSFVFDSKGIYLGRNHKNDYTLSRYYLKSEPIEIEHVIVYSGKFIDIRGSESDYLASWIEAGKRSRPLPRINYLYEPNKKIFHKLPDISITIQPDADKKKIEIPKEFWDELREAIKQIKEVKVDKEASGGVGGRGRFDE